MSLLDEALGASECVISVMGAHAGEDAAVIFERKIEDCRAVGHTFWVAKSAKARPQQVQAFCGSGRGYVIFVEPLLPAERALQRNLPPPRSTRRTESCGRRFLKGSGLSPGRWMPTPPR